MVYQLNQEDFFALPHLLCYGMQFLIYPFGGSPLERSGADYFLPILEFSTKDEKESNFLLQTVCLFSVNGKEQCYCACGFMF